MGGTFSGITLLVRVMVPICSFVNESILCFFAASWSRIAWQWQGKVSQLDKLLVSLYMIPCQYPSSTLWLLWVLHIYSLAIHTAVNYTLYADNRTSGLQPRASFNSTGGSVISGQASLSVSTDPCSFRMDVIVYVGAGSNPVRGARHIGTNRYSLPYIASFLILVR